MFSDKEKNNFILTILASILAANGLITNSVTGIICSMLVSPYLSVISEISVKLFNSVVSKFSIISIFNIIKHDVLVLNIYIGISMMIGLLYYLIQKNILGVEKIDIIRENSEMVNRADLNYKEYISIFVFATISGITIGFISNNNNYSESVKNIVMSGIGIGVSLLPMVVNSGLYLIEDNRKYAFKSLSGGLLNIIGIIFGIISFLYYNTF